MTSIGSASAEGLALFSASLLSIRLSYYRLQFQLFNILATLYVANCKSTSLEEAHYVTVHVKADTQCNACDTTIERLIM